MPELNISSLGLFAGDEHQPFFWEGGQPAALFIHGFMGTPAEMRPLARELHQANWTVQGLLLPGFGQQIDTLFDRRNREWFEETQSALVELQAKHQPVILIGYSMGAAVALNVAAETAPDKLILLAPFLRIGNTLHKIIWQTAKHLFPRLQPFKKADFSDARINELFGGLMPELDLDDPQVQEELRHLSVPARFVDQVLDIGRAAEKVAAQIQTPSMIIQGTQDQAVDPARTRQLLQQLPGPITYQELETDHGIVEATNPYFQQMVRSVLTFAEGNAVTRNSEFLENVGSLAKMDL
ncbi:MAG: alpha/beta fold hydrolase [Chloroflexota bacterium]